MGKFENCVKEYSSGKTPQQQQEYSKIKNKLIDPSVKAFKITDGLSAVQEVIAELTAEKESILGKIGETVSVKTGSRKSIIKDEIVSLQETIDDITIPENIRAASEKRLNVLLERSTEPVESKIQSGKLDQTYGTKKTDWVKETINGIETYVQGNAIIHKISDKRWLVAQKDEYGARSTVGEFKTMSDAKASLNNPELIKERTKKKTNAAIRKETPLTEDQKALLEKVDVEKAAGMAVQMSKDVRDDPEANGIAHEAIVDAAKSFKPGMKTKDGKSIAFSTYAIGKAKNSLKTYFMERTAREATEVQSTTLDSKEGSEATTKIENVSKREAASIPKQDRQRQPSEAEMKGEAAPIKKVELSAEEKAKALERVKAKTLREQQLAKSKVTAKEEKPAEEVPEEAKDEAPKDIIIRKAKTKSLPTESVEEVPDHIKQSREILDRVNGSNKKALEIADSIKDVETRNKVIAHINSVRQSTVGNIIGNALNTLDKTSETYKLAQWVNKLLTSSNKKNIKIVVDPTLDNQYFDRNTGIVYLNKSYTNNITIHEVVHAITSRELGVNPQLAAKVRDAMDLYREYVISNKDINLTKADLKRLEGITTSKEFQKEFGNESFPGDKGSERGILYALLNEREFLAQAMNDKRFQDTLKAMPAPTGSKFKTMWENIVSLFKEIFGVTGVNNNMMEEVLSLIEETSQVDLSYHREGTSEAADGMMVGEGSLVSKGTLADAQTQLRDGISKEQIRKDTGWLFDRDGRWKYEISDIDSKFLSPISSYSAGQSVTLGELLDHKELYKSYPDLKDMRVIFVNEVLGDSENVGAYDHITETLTLKVGRDAVEVLDTTLHEIQHVIQTKEDFGRGGDMQTIRLTNAIPLLRKFLSDRIEQHQGDQAKIDLYEYYNGIVDSIEYNKESMDMLYNSFESNDRAALQYLPGLLDVNTEQITQLEYVVYSRLLGEAEARNTSARKNLTAKELKETSLQETADVSLDDTIVLTSDTFDYADSVQASITPKTLKQKEDIMAKNDIHATKLGFLSHYARTKFIPAIKDSVVSVTERLREIMPDLLKYVRQFEFRINKYNVQYHEESKEFVDKYKKLDRKTQRLLTYSILNDYPDDIELRWKILKENKMEKAYEKVDAVLKDIHRRKQLVALGDYKSTPGYWPRRVMDYTALIQSMKGDKNYGLIEAELSKAGLNKADREKAVMSMIHTGRYPALALLKPGSEKGRTIKRVSSEWIHHYESPVDSLISHIYESNEAIEARNMFGDVKRATLVQDRDSLYEKLEKTTAEKARKEIVSKIALLEDQLSKYQEEWSEGIATKLAKDGHTLDATQQSEVIQLIRGRLTQRGMTGLWATLRNVSLMTVLGSPMSAITQLSDFAIAAHTNGLSNTVGSLFGNKRITTKDLDLSHSMREFQTGGSAKLLDRVLTLSGLKFFDTFGKNTFMNAAIEKAKKQSLAEFKKDWESQLGEETEATYNELKGNKTTDLTRFFAFNALSEMQPVSLSEMPLKYLTAGNGRMIYALKSYNIKAINNLRRKIWYDVRSAKTSKEKRAAIADASTLLLVMVLAGASADELKDLIQGKDHDFSDQVHNNLLKVFFLSQYTMENGTKKGMVKTILSDTLLPPTRLYDDVFTDVRNLVDGDPDTKTTTKFIKSVPWGALVYSHTSEGQDSNYTAMKKRVTETYKESGSMSDIRSEMVKYNKWAASAGEKPITYKSLQNSRKKDAKKNKQ